MQKRWVGVTHAVLNIRSFSLPWAYLEDWGNTGSVFGMNLTTGSDRQRFGAVMGFLMTGAIMAAAGYLWKRWRKTEGAKAAAMRFALVALYAIIAGGSPEQIWLGYLTTLLRSAPIPSFRFVNYAHRKLKRHGGRRSPARGIGKHPSGGQESAQQAEPAASKAERRPKLPAGQRHEPCHIPKGAPGSQLLSTHFIF